MKEMKKKTDVYEKTKEWIRYQDNIWLPISSWIKLLNKWRRANAPIDWILSDWHRNQRLFISIFDWVVFFLISFVIRKNFDLWIFILSKKKFIDFAKKVFLFLSEKENKEIYGIFCFWPHQNHRIISQSTFHLERNSKCWYIKEKF